MARTGGHFGDRDKMARDRRHRQATAEWPVACAGEPYSYGQAVSFKFSMCRAIVPAFYHRMIISIARPVAGLFVVWLLGNPATEVRRWPKQLNKPLISGCY